VALADARTLHDLVALRAAGQPGADAAVDGDTRLGNADLAERVDAIALALLAAGVQPGDRVATLAPPSLDFWLTYLAATSIGAIWQGLNPKYQRNEYAYLLADATPRVVFVRSPFDGRDYLEELQPLAAHAPRFVRLADTPLDGMHPFVAEGAAVDPGMLAARRAAVQPEDPAVVVYTSGTTGRPKGALLSHRAIVQTALAHVEWIGDGLDCVIDPAPINHVGGLNNVCMVVFAAGGRIVFVPRVDFALLGAATAREKPTYLVGSPTAFAMMLAIPGFSFEAYRGLYRVVVFGGASTPVAHLEQLRQSGARMSSVYGQTETTGMITYTAFDAPLPVVSETIGRPIRGMEVRVAAPDGGALAPGGTGEIQVRGISVMSGYLNRPEDTRDAFTDDGWLKTGDLGVVRPDGEIAFAGRLREMFKSGGYNCYPVEIELAICEHPDVAQAAVVAVAHEVFQEVGHAFVQPRPGRTVDPAALEAFLRERIARYKIPKTWSVLETFATLPNGKIDKRAMRAALDLAGAAPPTDDGARR
jgi:acyl-CoA synthetase (AMP-forming)/AMP-acid ligase II